MKWQVFAVLGFLAAFGAVRGTDLPPASAEEAPAPLPEPPAVPEPPSVPEVPPAPTVPPVPGVPEAPTLPPTPEAPPAPEVPTPPEVPAPAVPTPEAPPVPPAPTPEGVPVPPPPPPPAAERREGILLGPAQYAGERRAVAVVWDERVSPALDCNPTHTQHTWVVTVVDQCGDPIPGQRVEWILSRHPAAVGDIVATDDQYHSSWIAPMKGGVLPTNSGNKIDNHFAVSFTNYQDEYLDAANNYPWIDASGRRMPDIRIGRGQSWITITSPVEGVTDVVAYVPAIRDGSRHKIFARKVWADYAVTFPESATNLLPNASHAFTTSVRRASDGQGIAGVPVAAEILDGPEATFENGDRAITLYTGADGSATAVLHNRGMKAGTNRIRFTARGRFLDQECPRSAVVTKTWQQVQLECACEVSAASVNWNDPVEATFEVRNRGDTVSGPVFLELAPPPGLAVADGTVFPLELGPVPAGGVASRTVRFSAVAQGTQQITWRASSAQGAAATQCGCSVEVLQGSLATSCVIEPATVDVDMPFRVVATVANEGRGLLRNLRIEVAWPEGVTPRTQNVATLAELPAGQTDRFVFEASSPKPGLLVAGVTANAEGFPPVSGQCQVNVLQCALEAELVVPPRIGFAEPATLTLRVTNRGDGPARGVVARVTHAAGLEGGTRDLTLGDIAPGQTVAQDWPTRGLALGLHSVVADLAAPGCQTRREAEIEVTGLPALQVEMTDKDISGAEKGIFEIGEEYIYVLEVVNDVGTEPTPPLRVMLQMPQEVEFLSASSNRGADMTPGEGGIFSAPFTLDVNQKIVFQIRVRAAGVPPGNLVQVQATIQRASDGAALASESESTTIKERK